MKTTQLQKAAADLGTWAEAAPPSTSRRRACRKGAREDRWLSAGTTTRPGRPSIWMGVGGHGYKTHTQMCIYTEHIDLLLRENIYSDRIHTQPREYVLNGSGRILQHTNHEFVVTAQHSTAQPINRSINQSINQSMDGWSTINQSINQSIYLYTEQT